MIKTIIFLNIQINNISLKVKLIFFSKKFQAFHIGSNSSKLNYNLNDILTTNLL